MRTVQSINSVGCIKVTLVLYRIGRYIVVVMASFVLGVEVKTVSVLHAKIVARIVAVEDGQAHERMLGDLVVLEPLVIDALISRGLLWPVLGHDVQLGDPAVDEEDTAHADWLLRAILVQEDSSNGFSVVCLVGSLLRMNPEHLALLVLT